MEMLGVANKLKENAQKQGNRQFNLRSGIHSGPVVIGTVGVKKFRYDIWGDTVNAASKLESTSEPERKKCK